MTESEDSRAPVPKRGSSAMTEPERLRAHARRSLEFADAIADQEAARALKAYAAELAPGGRADRGKGGRRRRGEHGGGTGRSGGEHHDSHGARPRDRPGSERITGVFFDFPDFRTKWLELLREVIPGLASIALLWDPASGVAQLEALQAAGDQLRLKARTLKVSAVGELEEAFATASRDGVDALLVLSSPLFGARPSVLAGLALRHKLPTVTLFPDFARAGGLIAYGPNLLDTYRPLGPLVGKILHGAKPADLPVERPSKFELVVNVKTAKEIGVTIPTSLLLRADEVIE